MFRCKCNVGPGIYRNNIHIYTLYININVLYTYAHTHITYIYIHILKIYIYIFIYLFICAHVSHIELLIYLHCVGILEACSEPRVCQHYPFALMLRWSQFRSKSKIFENLLQADMLCADGAARLTLPGFVQK